MALGDHDTQHLAYVFNAFGGKHRLIVHKRGQQSVAGNVVSSDDRMNARGGTHRAQVQGDDTSMGNIA